MQNANCDKKSYDKGSWNYNSGNWVNESDRKWAASSSSVTLVFDQSLNGKTSYALTKYDYDANYGYKLENLIIPDNGTYTFKFNLNYDNAHDALSGVAESLSIVDSKPYGSFEWEGANPISLTLTQGTYMFI